MGQIYYSFDPTKGSYEIKDLFDLLHRYYPDIPADPKSFNKQNFVSDSEKDRTIRELNELIKRHEIDNEKNNKELESLRGKLKETEELYEEAKKLSIQIEKLKEENAAKEEKYQTDFKNEINKIKSEKEEEIALLRKQIEWYVKKLANYEPSLNGDVGNEKYFNIDGVNLQETFSSDAPFIGKVDADGNAIFTFNVDKGPHKYYAQNVSEIENYCEIIDSVEGTNHIGLGEWGKGKFNNGLLVVVEKAKIKLVRE